MANSLLHSLAALMLVVAWPTMGWSQESVQTAQTLYASASYDEALAVLERLQQTELTPSEVRVINEQRAFCLLALGRAQDAERAIAAVVQADPTYRPDGASASPRVRNAFGDVRGRLLPGIVQAEYVEARRLYDASSWADAATAFQRVASLAADNDLAEAQVASLADLRMLADGFATLAETAATPPPPPPEPPALPEPPSPPPVDYDAIFDGTQVGVVAPVTVRQDLPRWPGGGRPVPRGTGVLDIIVSKTGVVERATLSPKIAGFFDRQVLDSTKNWRYQPALLDGQPVRFRRIIKITFQ
ncbi:MAG: energy transducer TonB [Vicinamibacteria bacterium]|nr:energy transducer TonB [Vicinamibacteria bacterium]